jgi:hypothetical protein
MTSNTRSKAEMRQNFFEQSLLPKLRAERPMWGWRIHDHSPNGGWANLHRVKLDLWMGAGFTAVLSGSKRVRDKAHSERNSYSQERKTMLLLPLPQSEVRSIQ